MNFLCEVFNVEENNLFFIKHYRNENQNEYKNEMFYINGDSLYYQDGNNAKDVLDKMYCGTYLLKR